MILTLDAADAARFGCEPRLPFDMMDVTVADMAELSQRFDFEVEDWPYPLQGEIPLEQAGNPDAVVKPPPWQRWALVWMALRQNGCAVSWDDAGTVRLFRTRIERDDPPGKDGAAPTSPTSEPSTTPLSETSTD